MNLLLIVLIGFISGMGIMVIINLYKFTLKYFNRQR